MVNTGNADILDYCRITLSITGFRRGVKSTDHATEATMHPPRSAIAALWQSTLTRAGTRTKLGLDRLGVP